MTGRLDRILRADEPREAARCAGVVNPGAAHIVSADRSAKKANRIGATKAPPAHDMPSSDFQHALSASVLEGQAISADPAIIEP